MKKLLIVVDYQNDFIDGALGFPGAEKLSPIIAGKIKKARVDGTDVIFTLDTHGENYPETSEGRHLPVPHCIKGTKGHELREEIKALVEPCDRIIEKPSFGSAELFDILRGSGCTDIELCGLVTDICVVSNAIIAKTALPEANVTVDSAAVASFDKAKHDAALEVMKSVQVNVV